MDSFQPLWHAGPVPGNFYKFPGNLQNSDYDVLETYSHGNQNNNSQITTGTSIVGIKYDGGVVIAADNLVSYYNLARFNNFQRVRAVNKKLVWGFSGDAADFQNLNNDIIMKKSDDISLNDKTILGPKDLYNWLTNVLYRRRCWGNQYYLDLVVGGIQNNEPFLGHINPRGKAYEDTFIATGYGAHMALPLLRENNGNINEAPLMTREEAHKKIDDCMKVLYYRDCRAYPVYTIAECYLVGDETITSEKEVEIQSDFSFAKHISGY